MYDAPSFIYIFAILFFPPYLFKYSVKDFLIQAITENLFSMAKENSFKKREIYIKCER